jgi:O-antigen/teichoic acid export membrane protein
VSPETGRGGRVRQGWLRRLESRLLGSFSGRAGVVLFGSALGQGIAFLLLPLTARIYPPDVLGRAATTLAVLGVVGLLGSLQYDQAIIVAVDRDIPPLLLLAYAIAVAWVLLFTALVVFSGLMWPRGQQLLDEYGVNKYLLLLLLSYTLFLILINYHLRCNQLRHVSAGRLMYYGGGAALQVIGGYTLGAKESVYLLAQGVAAVAAVLYLFPYRKALSWSTRDANSVKGTLAGMRSCATRYRDFPRYQAGAQFLNALSVQVPVVVMRVAFSATWAGWYFLAYRLLAAPTALLAQAVGQVFYRDSAERQRLGLESGQMLEGVVTGLIRVSLLPAIAIGIMAPFLVNTFMGAEWAPVARMLQILLIPFVVSFVVSPISTLLNVKNRQRAALIYNALLFAARSSGLLIGWWLHSGWLAIWGYALGSLMVLLPFLRYVLQSGHASLRIILRGVQTFLIDAVLLLGLAAVLQMLGWLDQWLGMIVIILALTVIALNEIRRLRPNLSVW